MPELRLDQIGKCFPPARQVLQDVSFTIASGECLALVGPSGCGKTTLLRIIAGLEPPTTGAVHMDGQSVNHVPCHLRDVALMFQRPALVPNRTVRQNLGWAWSLRKPWAFLRSTNQSREQELLRIARVLGLESDLDRPIQQLSGGQQQRVALGRCLLRRAKICLLDEPLGHLDAPLRSELRRQIRLLAKELHVTLIHVTHDPEEALAVGDRVAVMQEGRIVQIDEPEQLLRRPRNRFVAELVHHQQGGLNVLAGQLIRDADRAFFASDFGRWLIPEHAAHALIEMFRRDKNFPADDGKVHIMLGIAAGDVRCQYDDEARSGEIRLVIPVSHHECSSIGSWIIGADARGQWIGRAGSLDRRNEVAMTFNLERAYWFDGATGQTLRAPAG